MEAIPVQYFSFAILIAGIVQIILMVKHGKMIKNGGKG